MTALAPAIAGTAAGTLRYVGAAAVAVLSCILLLPVFRLEDIPGPAAACVIALAVLAAWRSHYALLALAALVPIASWVGTAWPGSIAWPELLVVAFCAGYAWRLVADRSTPADDVDLPALVLAVVVAASLIVELLALRGRLGSDVFVRDLWQLLTRDYYIGNSGFPELDAGMRLLEGLLLYRASARAALAVPAFPRQVMGGLVLGGAAAAWINVLRVWEVARRHEPDAPFDAFLRYIVELRVNVHHMDLNAAGSYFVMLLFPAVAIVVVRSRVWWAALAALVAAGLWISGSRTALAAGALSVIATVIVVAASAAAPRVRRVFAGVAILVVTALAAGAIYLPARTDHVSSATAVTVRAEFAATSVRMWASRPLTGVGVGRYPARAADFASENLTRVFPGAGMENAHNNFLQVLAELGLAGFLPLLWILGAAAAHARGLLTSPTARHLGLGAIAGLIAFLATWMGGHPLLIDAVAFPFWILLGTTMGWGRTAGGLREWRSRRAQIATTAIVAAIVLGIPLRVQRVVAEAELDHVGIGVSQWHHDPEGVRFRTAGTESTVFVPAHVRAVTIPLRALSPTATLLVELSLGGRHRDVVRVTGDGWRQLRMIVPAESDRRYLPLRIRVQGVRSSEPVLMIGRVEAR